MGEDSELLDELDENGQFLGHTVKRGDAHKNGNWHRAVVLYLVSSKNQVLLQRRSLKKKKWPGYWDLTSGGHVDAGELGLGSAIRELEEELGISVEVKDVRYIAGRRTQTEKFGMVDKHHNEYYVAFKDVDVKDIKLNKDEVEEAKWFDLSEFKKMVKAKDEKLTAKWAAYEFLLKYIDTYGKN
ncbi:MAG: NUDIX domain-containing protein [Firmicutes bacterium]|nr:NUDIX domain-containing protein [Bacillota bacterium]